LARRGPNLKEAQKAQRFPQTQMVMNSRNRKVVPPIPEEITLSRDLGVFTITMIGVGGMIGAGIFVLTGIAAGLAGPALVLAFVLNGLITVLAAMAYAELGSAFPEAGGGYLWAKEGLGGAQGFLAGCRAIVARRNGLPGADTARVVRLSLVRRHSSSSGRMLTALSNKRWEKSSHPRGCRHPRPTRMKGLKTSPVDQSPHLEPHPTNHIGKQISHRPVCLDTCKPLRNPEGSALTVTQKPGFVQIVRWCCRRDLVHRRLLPTMTGRHRRHRLPFQRKAAHGV